MGKEVAKLDDEVKGTFANELTILETRKRTLQQVVSDNEDAEGKLQLAISEHLRRDENAKAAVKMAGQDAAAIARAARARMGSAPPCKSVRALETFKDFNRMKDQFHTCDTQADIDHMTELLRPARDAINEIISYSKQPLTHLLNLVKQSETKSKEKEETRGSKRAAASQKRLPKQTSLACALAEIGPDIAQPIPRCTLDKMASEMMCDMPLVVGLGKDAECFGVKMDFAKSVDGFLPKFNRGREQSIKAAEEKKAKGDMSATDCAMAPYRYRCQKVLQPDVAQRMGEMVVGEWLAASKMQVIPTGNLPVELVCRPSMFGISQGFDGVANVPCFMGALRLTFSGTRVVDLAQLTTLMTKLEVKKNTLEDLKATFHSLTKEQLRSLFSAKEVASLWCATIAAHDLLWVPPGFVIFEHVQTQVMGCRIGIVVKGHKQLFEDLGQRIKTYTGTEWESGALVLKAINDSETRGPEPESRESIGQVAKPAERAAPESGEAAAAAAGSAAVAPAAAADDSAADAAAASADKKLSSGDAPGEEEPWKKGKGGGKCGKGGGCIDSKLLGIRAKAAAKPLAGKAAKTS